MRCFLAQIEPRGFLEKMDAVAVSVDGQPDLHDMLRLSPGAFDKMLEGVGGGRGGEGKGGGKERGGRGGGRGRGGGMFGMFGLAVVLKNTGKHTAMNWRHCLKKPGSKS